MLSRPLRIAALQGSPAAVGRKRGPPEGPCSLTCSRTRRIIAVRFLCWPTSSATASCTKRPASGTGRSSGNKPALPRARAEWNPPSRLFVAPASRRRWFFLGQPRTRVLRLSRPDLELEGEATSHLFAKATKRWGTRHQEGAARDGCATRR